MLLIMSTFQGLHCSLYRIFYYKMNRNENVIQNSQNIEWTLIVDKVLSQFLYDLFFDYHAVCTLSVLLAVS